VRSQPADSPAPAGDLVEAALDTEQAGPRAIRGAGLRTLSFVAGGLLALASAPLLLRHLGVVDFGRYVTVVSLIALVGGLTEGGLSLIGVREYATLPRPERNRFMRNLLGLRMVLSGAAVLIAVLFALLAGYGAEMVMGTVVAGVGLLILSVQGTLAVPLNVNLNIGRQVAAELARQVVTVILVVVLVLSAAGIVPLLAISIPTGLLLLGATVVFVRGSTSLIPSFELGSWRQILRSAFPVAAATAVQTMYFRSVIIVMSLVAVDLQTGYFATSYRLLEVLLGIPVILVGTTFPILARAAGRDRARLVYATHRILEVGFLVGLGFAVCAALGAKPAISLLAGPGSEPSVPVLRIQAATLLLSFVSTGCLFVLLSLERYRGLLWASLAALVSTVAAALLLVPAHQAIGGAIAAAIGEVVLMVALFVTLFGPEADLRPSLGFVPKALLAAAVGAGLPLLLSLPDIADVLAFAVVYAMVLMVIGAIPWELRHALEERIREHRRRPRRKPDRARSDGDGAA